MWRTPKPMTAAIRGEFDMPGRDTSTRRNLRIDRTGFPYGDLDSQIILEQAVLDLVIYRGGHYVDPAASISALVSLIAEAESWLYELVADARDYGYTWSQIADRLANTVPAVRHRYAAYTIWRRDHPARTLTLDMTGHDDGLEIYFRV
jgi:hypothetical protein